MDNITNYCITGNILILLLLYLLNYNKLSEDYFTISDITNDDKYKYLCILSFSIITILIYFMLKKKIILLLLIFIILVLFFNKNNYPTLHSIFSPIIFYILFVLIFQLIINKYHYIVLLLLSLIMIIGNIYNNKYILGTCEILFILFLSYIFYYYKKFE